MKRLILLLSCFTFLVESIVGQGLIEKQAINKLMLYKVCCGVTEAEAPGNSFELPCDSLLTCDRSLYRGRNIYYYDMAGRIRKRHSKWFDEDGFTSTSITYYNTRGELCYELCVDSRCMGDYLMGIFIYDGAYLRRSDGYVSIDPDYFDFNIVNKKIVGDSIKLWINGYEYKQYLISNIQDRPPKSLTKYKKVYFVTPCVGSTTFVNSHHVNIREAPSTDSKITDKIKACNQVKILSVCKPEFIKGIGCYNWYFVEYDSYKYDNDIGGMALYRGTTGHIFGAFLEPVEKVITE